jgi:hypothetical protein
MEIDRDQKRLERQYQGIQQLVAERDAQDPNWREKERAEIEAAEQRAAERAAWIATLPHKLDEWTFVERGEVVDQQGNFICSLPATGSSIEQIIAAADAAQEVYNE